LRIRSVLTLFCFLLRLQVFIRELVSNASDSLEKLRHMQATNTPIFEPDTPLEIRIDIDEVATSITITDTGIGMTKEEMISNLGTIARSGSKNFVQQLERMEVDKTHMAGEAGRGIIGQFGVGFYSAFMVGRKVQVRSQPAMLDQAGEGPKVWTSEGTGTFSVSDMDEGIRQGRGTSVVIDVDPNHWDIVDEAAVEKVLKRYSNFVNFPIYLNGKLVNTLSAIWAKDPKEVTTEEYVDFYKYIANAIDSPLDTYHFRVDAPLDVKALLYIPSFHSEKYGMARMEPGVSLYSRKILIESKSPDILPDWMRFVKGVVDSEDLPLAISREKAQDSALIAKLRKALVRKFIAHLRKMVKDDRPRYLDEFYKEYSFFLKEGICQDPEWQESLCKLLYFETNKNSWRHIKSLDEYISSMRPEQKAIYYIIAPTREAAEQSPYMEAFKKAGIEVIFLYTAVDDFVMGNLKTYEGRDLVSVEKGDIDLSEMIKEEKNEEKNLYESDRELTKEEIISFCNWFRKTLGEHRVATCTTTDRLDTSPAIVTDNESGAMRRMMRFVDTSQESRDSVPLPKQNVLINPKHKVIVGIQELRDSEPFLASTLAEQVFDNSLIAAGLLDDTRTMLPRLNDLILTVVNGAKAQTTLDSLVDEVEMVSSAIEKHQAKEKLAEVTDEAQHTEKK
jgi:TNF receptor-associated protein 1